MEDMKKDNETPKPGTKDAMKAELEALKAENEALKAQNEALTSAAEAEPSMSVEAAEPEEEEIFIPKGYANDEPNLFVSVNGKNYLLPKGKRSKVPTAVAKEIRRSWKAQDIMDAHIDEMIEATK